MHGGQIGIVVTLSQHGQELSGSISTSDDTEPSPIENGEIRGDTVTFEMHDNANRIVKFRLALTDGLMRGEVSLGDQVSKLELSPASDSGFYPIAGGLLSSSPLLLRKVEPAYTEEARAARVQGVVVLQVEIDPGGKVAMTHITVIRSLGLGLDEKAIEAVKQWHFQPVVNQWQLSVATRIAVDFRLSSKQSRWHLIRVQFENPPGTAPPVFVNALYPIGAGLGPEAMEEGQLVVAMGRLATARLRFEVDEHGLPSHFEIPNASEAIWGSEAMALVGQWRFTPGMRNGLAVPVPCTVELVWGARELSASSLADVRASLELK
jgi:TonB family protein